MSDTTSAQRFNKAFDEVCDKVMCALQAEYEYGDIDALIVLARALKKRSTSTPDELAEIWIKELGPDLDVHHGVIGSVIVLNGCLGPDWPVLLVAHSNRNDCFLGNAPVSRRIEDTRNTWDGWCREFDEKRAKEEEAAMAWMGRRVRKAA